MPPAELLGATKHIKDATPVRVLGVLKDHDSIASPDTSTTLVCSPPLYPLPHPSPTLYDRLAPTPAERPGKEEQTRHPARRVGTAPR